jgi:hypothetical protein
VREGRLDHLRLRTEPDRARDRLKADEPSALRWAEAIEPDPPVTPRVKVPYLHPLRFEIERDLEDALILHVRVDRDLSPPPIVLGAEG